MNVCSGFTWRQAPCRYDDPDDRIARHCAGFFVAAELAQTPEKPPLFPRRFFVFFSSEHISGSQPETKYQLNHSLSGAHETIRTSDLPLRSGNLPLFYWAFGQYRNIVKRYKPLNYLE